MDSAFVVIGAGYGDEGKGSVTDWLCGELYDPVVVRFNSGAQAAHTVCLENGDRNVFSSIGSGTFRGISTILSRFFVVSPELFLNETFNFHNTYKKKVPRIYVDPRCQVTTPYDVAYNRLVENLRGTEKHGSCGIGFGATVGRSDTVSLTVSDMAFEEIFKNKMNEILRYYIGLVKDGGYDVKEYLQGIDTHFFDRCANEFLRCITVLEDVMAMELYNNIVFEGAQGLFLDQASDDFPHVTRSNTGLHNISELINSNIPVEVYYVTRSYCTRHGAGPLIGEDEKYYVYDDTNQANDYQDILRFAPLNYKRMRLAIDHDVADNIGEYKDVKVNCVVTHCDNNIVEENLDTLMTKIKEVYDFDCVYQSFSPIGAKIERHSEKMVKSSDEIFNCKMQPNDANAYNVKEYLRKLLVTLWTEGESFSGKRPFGNGGWQSDIYKSLATEGIIEGEFETYDVENVYGDTQEYTDFIDCDYDKADQLILQAIRDL